MHIFFNTTFFVTSSSKCEGTHRTFSPRMLQSYLLPLSLLIFSDFGPKDVKNTEPCYLNRTLNRGYYFYEQDTERQKDITLILNFSLEHQVEILYLLLYYKGNP